jgi:hypothetical protein
MNYLRRHMDPDTLQLLLFLKYNREFWDSLFSARTALRIDDAYVAGSRVCSGGGALRGATGFLKILTASVS